MFSLFYCRFKNIYLSVLLSFNIHIKIKYNTTNSKIQDYFKHRFGLKIYIYKVRNHARQQRLIKTL